MAWYWPDFNSPQGAKTAVVNAVGVSALFAVWLFLPALLTLVFTSPSANRNCGFHQTVAVILAMIGWGIYRMSPTAAVAGVVWWLVWFGFRPLFLLAIAYQTGNPFGFIWPALNLLFLLFYVIAVRATFAYYRHFATTPTVITR